MKIQLLIGRIIEALADTSSARVCVNPAERSAGLFWHEHFQRILVVAREHLSLEHLKVLSVDVVLVLTPCWATLLVLQSPVDREKRCQHRELIAGDEHLVHLSVPRVAVADESLVVRGIAVRRDEKRLVKELNVDEEEKCEKFPGRLRSFSYLEVGHRMADLHLVSLSQVRLPPGRRRKSFLITRAWKRRPKSQLTERSSWRTDCR
jgi:hypothetical protein